jgi:hypothetical protein
MQCFLKLFVRTSQNALKAKFNFRESPFHALRCIESSRLIRDTVCLSMFGSLRSASMRVELL